MYQVDPSCVCHKRSSDARFRSLVSRKEPSHEVDGGDGHADTEEHAREYTLRTAFPKGEGQSGDDDGDKREPSGDGAGEGLLQYIDRVLPWRVGLGKHGPGENERDEKRHGAAGKTKTAKETQDSCLHGTSKEFQKHTPDKWGVHAVLPEFGLSVSLASPLSAEPMRRRKETASGLLPEVLVPRNGRVNSLSYLISAGAAKCVARVRKYSCDTSREMRVR